jgi:hypothetical protein
MAYFLGFWLTACLFAVTNLNGYWFERNRHLPRGERATWMAIVAGAWIWILFLLMIIWRYLIGSGFVPPGRTTSGGCAVAMFGG